MGLRDYHRKRDFARTREPRGAEGEGQRWRYLIQKHDATRLHYDFRLELDGVLLSWAVPKGPSLDPKDRRLAVHVEDHPLEYGTFEGTIPKGQYGGGTVLLWDRGTWEPVPGRTAQAAYAKGHLEFLLHGEKLRGRWHLLRTGGASGKKEQWLLFKAHDDEARTGGVPIVDAAPESVATGRSLAAVTVDAKVRPAFLPVQLATLATTPPEGDDWVHELKYDGYRIEGVLVGGKATLFSRNGTDWTDRMPGLARALEAWPVRDAILDGEVVVLREDGVSDFGRLQDVLANGRGALTWYVFDLLGLEGDDWRERPLSERKERLRALVPPGDVIRYSGHVDHSAEQFLAQACAHEAEGVVSKRRSAPYRAGRGGDWVKVKCRARQEFIIVGWTAGKAGPAALGALLVATRARGTLTYVGKVGTGFTARGARDLLARLRALETEQAPVTPPPDEKGARWVEPTLVAEVRYANLTRDGRLRHAAFVGLRADKPATEVALEAPMPLIALSHPDKVLYPESGVTKGEVAAWLDQAAEWMLPHVVDRPLMLLRCPDGIGACFVQKHAGAHPPAGTSLADVGDDAPHLRITDAAGLRGLAQAGVLEIHTWGAHVPDIEHPDILVFDLDPDEALPWARVVDAARRVRARLEELDLDTYVKTTGGKGLHIVAPLPGPMTWDAAKTFSGEVARSLAAERPDEFVAVMSKRRRVGRVFVDYLRNGRGSTFVAPYSPRARPGAPVAMPLDWDELSPRTRPEAWTVRTAGRRLAALTHDPWAGLVRAAKGGA